MNGNILKSILIILFYKPQANETQRIKKKRRKEAKEEKTSAESDEWLLEGLKRKVLWQDEMIYRALILFFHRDVISGHGNEFSAQSSSKTFNCYDFFFRSPLYISKSDVQFLRVLTCKLIFLQPSKLHKNFCFEHVTPFSHKKCIFHLIL